MEFTTARYFESIGAVRFFDAERYVGLDFAEQAVAEVTAGDVVPFLTGERTVVDVENHGQGRFVDVDARQGFRILRVGNGFTDLEVGNADDAGDFAHTGFFLFDAL